MLINILPISCRGPHNREAFGPKCLYCGGLEPFSRGSEIVQGDHLCYQMNPDFDQGVSALSLLTFEVDEY